MVVKYELTDRVAHVLLNRPDKMNAINADMRAGLRDAFLEIDESDEAKVVILQGAGGRAFSAGADINEAGKRSAYERRQQAYWDPANVVRRCSKPVIALLQGYVLGGGLELASACDIRIAAESAVFGFPEIRHGWLPAGGGGTQQFPRVVGMGWAMRLILSGERIGSHKAKEIGLVQDVHADDAVETETWELARQIAQHRLRAIILAKSALRLSERAAFDVGMDYEREIATLTYYFEDRQEAIRAFQEKRDPELSD